MLQPFGAFPYRLRSGFTYTASVTCKHCTKFSVCYMGHSSVLGSPVLTYLQCFVISLQSYIRNGKNEQLPHQGVCSGTESCAFPGSTCSFPHLLTLFTFSNSNYFPDLAKCKRVLRFAPLRDRGEEAVCTLAVTEYKYFPWVKWLLPNPSI